MNSLTITVGIPGCGKSTLAEKLRVERTIDVIISSDDIREEVTGNMENQDANRVVFDLLYQRTRNALAQQLNVLVDATNLKPEYRRKLMVIALEERADLCQALLFEVSGKFDVCQERNLGRERVVPEFVMQRFHTMFLQNCTVAILKAEGWTVLPIPAE